MKRASTAYRLQLIKEVATKRQRELSNDAMANYIHDLLNDQPQREENVERNHRFSGSHFDEGAGGWVSDTWSLK
ncbi:hypothetical protein KP803_06415 [Vibrio sp. ZSDE26]|uniref:Uncharacterized protein n=1 Tax=Vibrio amylolyticus TaxID=2847292 RepID=A0A9X2BHG4_9VIBR|nr:hypothetical protein [Vibrio amylolyticus]MCK6262910.1 hypothetical protein [Vibrio amylolyticus]